MGQLEDAKTERERYFALHASAINRKESMSARETQNYKFLYCSPRNTRILSSVEGLWVGFLQGHL